MENKGFRDLGTKNGSYRKVPKDLVSRSGGLTFQRGSRRIFHRDLMYEERNGKRKPEIGNQTL